ncbi:MAG: valine--tRNA ligase, partial [Malacoplasma sp.]|nr:valine--tRNA ligase [Malacoplasma sp.]
MKNSQKIEKELNSKYDHNFCEKNFSLWNIQKKMNSKNLNASKNLFSILVPPPNITGKLHIGHALNLTIQDALIRFNLLNGKNAYWVCGMDHAGIATQTRYERYLKENKIVDNSKSREEKIKKLHTWSQQNASEIRQQWKNMGLFLDYDNEHFTFNEKSNEIVNQVFVKMYKDGLIYRSKTLVNWDTKLKTAISNIEVIKKEKETNLYFIKYLIKDSKDFLTVATTRPETIFVDECLVINPKDERYKKYLNKTVINPFTKKELPIISDSYVDKEFGTGVMKCTPAHDFNDFELSKKYNLKIESCFNEDGTTNEKAVGFENLKIADCREKCVEFLKNNNLLIKTEKIISSIGFSERTDVVVEPIMSEQWFVKVSDYAKKIVKIQKTNNKVVFHPKKYEKLLINWLSNLNDWCISRQLWWGHQIPVWYKKNSKEIYVETKPPKNPELYTRDNDVLDTWFSSGLWPITTTDSMTKKSPKYPTDILVTAFDIIFFWVFRMMFFGLYLKKELPFKNCYITGLIRDEQNRKMSKSLGNGINPSDVIKQYGADALRLFLLSSSSPGEDFSFSEAKIKSCWSFINKLWNSFRFIEMKNKKTETKNNYKSLSDFDKWILNKFSSTYQDFIKHFEKYNFLIAIKKLTDFVWDDFCNTYIELTKNRVENEEANIWVLNFILEKILILLHPICPFVTANLYDNFSLKTNNSILEELNIFKNLKKNYGQNNIDNVLS